MSNAFVFPAPAAQTNIQGTRSYAPELAKMARKVIAQNPADRKYSGIGYLAMAVEEGGYEMVNSIYDLRNYTRGDNMFELERVQAIAELSWKYLVGVSELFIDVLIDAGYQPTEAEQYLILEYGLTNADRDAWIGTEQHTALKAAYRAEQDAKKASQVSA